MDEKHKKNASKFLSLLLRHRPELIGLELDKNGWADVEELLSKLATHPSPLTRAELEEIVATNDKKRFVFNEDHRRIRANQGHSIEVDLDLEPQSPPEFLYHGTVEKFVADIQNDGLKRMDRQHVHLSKDLETAIAVGRRRGEAIILRIDSAAMHKAGFAFYLSENGVWLTNRVPAQYIRFNDSK